MKNLILLGLAALFLSGLLALSSLATAAAPGQPTPAAAQAAATPDPSTSDDADVGAEGLNAQKAPINPGSMTSRILVYNPDTSGPAMVRIDFVDSTGAIQGTISDFPVQPDGAVAKPLPAGITSPFSGSALISANRNVQAFVTNYNSTNTARDVYAGTAAPGTILTLPLVRHLAPTTQNSIIAVQNTGSSPANITLHLYDPSGNELTGLPGTSVTGVQPLASAYFDTNTIFPTGTFTGTGLVTADGVIALAAGEQTRFQKDTASFRALAPSDRGTTLYVNFVERKTSLTFVPQNWNELYVRNEGTNPTSVTVEYVTSAGASPMPATVFSSVPPGGQVSINDGTLAFKPLGTNFKGWVRITSGGEPLSAYSLENWNNGTRLFGMQAIPADQLGTLQVCGDVLKTSTQKSKITIMNPDPAATASVTIKLYIGSTGKSGGSKTVSIGPKKAVTLTSSDTAFTAAGTTFEAMALIALKSGPQVVTSVYTPWINSGVPGGVTSFVCSKLQ